MTHREAQTSAAAETARDQPPPPGRRARRLRPPMHCYWGQDEHCPRNGQITTLSDEGCFIKSTALAADGQPLFVNCWLPSERWLMLRGRVSYHLTKIGFGLTFDELSETEREMVSTLLEFYAEEATA